MNSFVRCSTVALAVMLGLGACSDSVSPPGEQSPNQTFFHTICQVTAS